jgi:hypothetical protein
MSQGIRPGRYWQSFKKCTAPIRKMADTYRADFLGPARTEFGAALARLASPNRNAAIAVMAGLLERLTQAPCEFGEEIYDLKSIGMQVRLGLRSPIESSLFSP